MALETSLGPADDAESTDSVSDPGSRTPSGSAGFEENWTTGGQGISGRIVRELNDDSRLRPRAMFGELGNASHDSTYQNTLIEDPDDQHRECPVGRRQELLRLMERRTAIANVSGLVAPWPA